MKKILYTLLIATALTTTSFAADLASKEKDSSLQTTDCQRHDILALKKLLDRLENITDQYTSRTTDSADDLFNRIVTLAKNGASLITKDTSIFSPLHFAANGCFTLEQFQTLFNIALHQGATIEALDGTGMTLLFSAVMTYSQVNQNSIDIINWLLDKGARTAIYHRYGKTSYTPFGMALTMDNVHRLPIEIIKRLKRHLSAEQISEEITKATEVIARHQLKALKSSISKCPTEESEKMATLATLLNLSGLIKYKVNSKNELPPTG
jgi:hypothetical protein